MTALARRVMVIGWDGAPPAIAFAERLPNLRRLMSEGAHARLRSTHPPITVPAWSVMTTSKNPGKLGFTGFRNLTRGTYDDQWIAFSTHVREPRVWDILGKEGKRVIVHGVPQTYPVSAVEGCLTSCFLTPSAQRQWTHPPSLADRITAVTGPYRFDVHDFRHRPPELVLEEIEAATECHHRAAEHLLAEEPWDFFMMVEMGTDRVQHAFWRFHDPEHRKHEPGRERVILDYYRALDDKLGRLLAHAGEDTLVMVVSDHGAKRMDGALNVNDFLRARGDLVLKREPQGVEPYSPENVDWSRTRAWALGGYYARIFINREGREPRGIVRPSEYEAYRRELADALRNVPDDSGQKMDTRVERPEDVYTGPFAREAPDLLAYFGDLHWRAHQSVGHDSLHAFEAEVGPDDATHDWDGILVAAGPGLAGARGGLGTIDLRDVAPTLLTALGLPVPPDMEGQPLQRLSKSQTPGEIA